MHGPRDEHYFDLERLPTVTFFKPSTVILNYFSATKNREEVKADLRRKIINDLPTLIKRAKRDPAFHQRMREPAQEAFWAAVLVGRRRGELPYQFKIRPCETYHFDEKQVARLEQQKRDRYGCTIKLKTTHAAFDQLAGQMSYQQHLNDYYLFNNMTRTLIEIQSMRVDPKNIPKYLARIREHFRITLILVQHPQIAELARKYQHESFNLMDIASDIQIIEKLAAEYSKRLTKTLDPQIALFQNFDAMEIRSSVDILKINLSRCCNLPKHIDQQEIGQMILRAKAIVSQHGLAGYVVLGRLYYELAEYCLTKPFLTPLEERYRDNMEKALDAATFLEATCDKSSLQKQQKCALLNKKMIHTKNWIDTSLTTFNQTKIAYLQKLDDARAPTRAYPTCRDESGHYNSLIPRKMP